MISAEAPEANSSVSADKNEQVSSARFMELRFRWSRLVLDRELLGRLKLRAGLVLHGDLDLGGHLLVLLERGLDLAQLAPRQLQGQLVSTIRRHRAAEHLRQQQLLRALD